MALNILLIHVALTMCINVVFNRAMNDATLIDRHGGPAKLAATLGYGPGGTQRVFNWKARGRIPSDVKLERQDLFGLDAVRMLEESPVVEPAQMLDRRRTDRREPTDDQVAGQGA